MDEANDDHPNYPARIYLLEGYVEHMYPEKKLLGEGESTIHTLDPISLHDIDWTYPNIIIYVTEYKEQVF